MCICAHKKDILKDTHSHIQAFIGSILDNLFLYQNESMYRITFIMILIRCLYLCLISRIAVFQRQQQQKSLLHSKMPQMFLHLTQITAYMYIKSYAHCNKINIIILDLNGVQRYNKFLLTDAKLICSITCR